MRRTLAILVAATLLSVPGAAVAQEEEPDAPEARTFWAWMDGSQEVPPVETEALGITGMQLTDGESELRSVVLTYGLEDVVAAHIHCGPEGENGPVGITLFEGDPVTRDGILVRGSATAPDEENGCGWADLAEAIEALRSGDTYVNVHTVAHPSGEIRGQVEPLAPPTTPGGTFTDDDGNVHEGNIEAIAAVRITRGCNPPQNDRYCPDSDITRGQMAAFLRRAFNLPASGEGFFTDDGHSEFEGDINAIAAAGITVGCNPPENDRYCPDDPVTRAQMASFLVRALELGS